MKKFVSCVVIVVIFLLSILLALAIASEESIKIDEKGYFDLSNVLPVNIKWVKAPQNPKVVYIAIYTPNERLSRCLETSIEKVVRAYRLKPVPVKNISRYDLRGRVVIGYFSVNTSNNLISRRVTVSGVLYYSFAGDVRSALKYINTSNITVISESSNCVRTLARKMSNASLYRLTSMKIINTSCKVFYWWNLKVETGVLSGKDPYKIVSDTVACQLSLALNENATSIIGAMNNGVKINGNRKCYENFENTQP